MNVQRQLKTFFAVVIRGTDESDEKGLFLHYFFGNFGPSNDVNTTRVDTHSPCDDVSIKNQNTATEININKFVHNLIK